MFSNTLLIDTFTKSSAIKFCDITSTNVGKPMGVLVDGKLVNVATIRERFCEGKAIITGNFSVDEANRSGISGWAGRCGKNLIPCGREQATSPSLRCPMQ